MSGGRVPLWAGAADAAGSEVGVDFADGASGRGGSLNFGLTPDGGRTKGDGGG